MAQAAPTIDRLLNLVPDSPSTVLRELQSHPELASKQDAHGYSLVHAAASYGHESLLEALIGDYSVDPNITDEDGETALFSVEEVRMAKALIDLGASITLRNDEGQTPAEKLDDEDEQPAVAAYLRSVASGTTSNGHAAGTETATADASSTLSTPSGEVSNGTHRPPPLPEGLHLNVGTMDAAEAGEEPDPEFRRRIEDLVAHPDYRSEEGQRELRALVMDAVSGLSNESQAPQASRRRLG